ncbi:UDP-glucuronate 4-epimerase [Paraburkholderia sp. GAS448]|uniref:NAD-dependent epimerase/dehydratase family protein n=1 Tax=Paraburkholderia sp. GAS448 TaxID=3035136 RepID=UPI003D1A4728
MSSGNGSRAHLPDAQDYQTVLVTGANGFVGRLVCEQLRSAYGRVIALDRAFALSDSSGPHADHRVVADLSDRAMIKALFEDEKITAVVHCGGISGPMLARDDPALVHRVNVVGTLNMLDCASRHHVQRFVHASSIAVYGDHPAIVAINESAALLAVDPYGTSKIASELIARSYRACSTLDVVALRFGSIYGPGRRTKCVVGALYASTLTGQPAVVSAASTNPRQLVYVDDCVDAIIAVLTTPRLPQFAYNIATNRIVSEAAVAALAAAIDSRVKYRIDTAEQFSDGRIGPLCIDAAQRDFGFVAKVDIVEGLNRYWHHRGDS